MLDACGAQRAIESRAFADFNTRAPERASFLSRCVWHKMATPKTLQPTFVLRFALTLCLCRTTVLCIPMWRPGKQITISVPLTRPVKEIAQNYSRHSAFTL